MVPAEAPSRQPRGQLCILPARFQRVETGYVGCRSCTIRPGLHRRVRELLVSPKWRDLVPPLPRQQPHENRLPPDAPVPTLYYAQILPRLIVSSPFQ